MINANRPSAKTLSPVIKGFEHIRRVWDDRLQAVVASISPGEFYISRNKEVIATYLGSCISVCIRDYKTHVGGMNHFMLPQKPRSSDNWVGSVVSESTRYGDWAMENLLNEIYKLGAKKNRLEIKVFGGGKVIASMNSKIGDQNIEFVMAFLEREGFAIEAMDIGDIYARKLYFFLDTGKVKVRKLAKHSETLIAAETRYSENIEEKISGGSIELF